LPKFHTLRHRALRRRRRAAGGREEASAAEARHLRADSAERQKAEEIAQCMREEAERQAEAAKAAQASADNAIERARKEHEEQCSEQGFDGSDEAGAEGSCPGCGDEIKARQCGESAHG